MKKFEEFLTQQELIYNKFRDISKVCKEGIAKDPALLKGKGGYFIILRHPENITNQLEEIANNIAKTVSSIPYTADKIHTTIVTYKPEDNFIPEKQILEKLRKIAKDCSFESKKFEINYAGILFNQTTVIAAGYPDLEFFELSNKILNKGKENGFEFKPPSMAHVTVSRFTENTNLEKLDEFMLLMKQTHFKEKSTPNAIDVGYFIAGEKDFNINVYERIDV